MANFSGIHLRNLRTAAGLTQQALGDRIDVSRETVVAIENDYDGTINKLTIDIVNKWWALCRRSVSPQTQAAFVAELLAFFDLSQME